MKRTLSVLMLATAFAAAAVAPFKPVTGQLLPPLEPNSGFISSSIDIPASQKHAMRAPAKAEGETLSLDYSPAGQPYRATAFQNQVAGTKVSIAFQLTTAQANMFAGNEITSVLFYTPINSTTSANDVRTATVYVAADATGQPGERIIENTVNLPTKGLTLCKADLGAPYPIEAGKKIFVGVEFTLASPEDIWLVYDFLDHGSDDCGGWVGNYGTRWNWQNISDKLGFACVGATITGTKLPQNQVAVLGVYTNPAEEQNKPFEVEFEIENEAANVVKNVKIKCTVGDLEPQYISSDLPEGVFGYNVSLNGSIPQITYPTPSLDGIDVTLEIVEVDGEPNQSPNSKASAKLTIIPEGKGYKRNAVIEEFTSVKCGYCPQGIVTMEALREKYPDGGLIPVAIHGDGMGTDPMTSRSFSQIESQFSTGSYPSAIMNRQFYVAPYPASSVINLYEELSKVPALTSVSATANFDPENDSRVVFHTTTEFSFDIADAADRYTLAFAITEDNVGPYDQHNYFGAEDVEMGGWENMGEWVSTIYNDVARQYASYRGINGSIPTSVVAGEKYNFEYTTNLVSAIQDLDNIHGVVYVINKATGAVENVTFVKTIGDTTGIEDIDAADNNSPVEYYNLQGVHVANPANGLYIRRQGTTTSKVFIR